MKIIGNDGLPGRIPAERPGSPTFNGFGEIFKQSLEQSSSAVSSSAQAGSVKVEYVAPVVHRSAPIRLEGFLDLLEGYCQKLSNPRVSLKALESSVQQLEKGRNDLSRMLGSLPEGDGLKDVLNQTLVTAEIEILKFRHGDYLPA
jgi:exonuclease VII small subunit